MKEPREFDVGEALARYADGRLSAREWAELERRLREDPAARELLTSMAWQATTLADLGRAKSTPPAVELRSPSSWFRRSAPWLAAAAVLAIAVVWSAWSRRERSILTVREISGAVAWMAGGQTQARLQPGDRLAAGTIVIENETGAGTFEFADGSRLILEGRAAAVVAENQYKTVRLVEGTLFATVRPQPAGRPMLVSTSTAEVRVLGTEFAVTAAEERSVVNVGRGRVELRRLSDGQRLEVGSGQSVAATLATNAPLRLRRDEVPANRWQRMFAEQPSAGWSGDWQPATAEAPARLRAVPMLAGRAWLGEILVFHGVKYHEPEEAGGGWVLLEAASQVRLRARLEADATLQVFVVLRSAPGRWGGNFMAELPATTGVLQSDGWRDFVVPVSSLQPRRPEVGTRVEGSLLAMLFINTRERDAGLEIASVEVGPP